MKGIFDFQHDISITVTISLASVAPFPFFPRTSAATLRPTVATKQQYPVCYFSHFEAYNTPAYVVTRWPDFNSISEMAR